MNNGRIKFKGKISARDTEPIIVVGFENNRDGYSNIKKQARMFNKCFEQLYERYEFNNCKCIGHSNGGLVWTCFLENYSKITTSALKTDDDRISLQFFGTVDEEEVADAV